MSRLRARGLTIDDPLAPVRTPTNVGTEQSEPADARLLSSRDRSVDSSATAPASRSLQRRSPELGAGTTDAAPHHGRAYADVNGTSPASGVWRSWSGPTRVASYRLPDELLTELGATASNLNLPVGLLVTAAITHLLDQPTTTIAALVDRADDARIVGRRNTRRLVGAPGPGEADASEHSVRL